MPILKKVIRQYLKILLLFCSTILCAQTQSVREYQIKAAYIFNFTNFVTWPSDSFSRSNSPFIIGILGDNPFDSNLKEIISGEYVNGHPVIIQQYYDLEDIRTCHILFINQIEIDKLKTADITALRKRSILTVSDAANFNLKGGVVKFYKKNNKIHLQINNEAAKAADLVISSKLLNLAEIFFQ